MDCYVQVTFAYAAGPLAWSVVAFRNSLVFHSLDKVFHLTCAVTHPRLGIVCCFVMHACSNCASQLFTSSFCEIVHKAV